MLRSFELLAIGVAGFFQHVGERGLFLFLLGLAFALGRTDVVLRHLQADLIGQILYGFHKAHAGMLHQKTDGIAVFAAAKAVKKLFAGADGEGRRFFTMKWAQAHEIGAAFFELHVAAHDVDHVDARKQLLDERLRNGHLCILPCLGKTSGCQGLRTDGVPKKEACAQNRHRLGLQMPGTLPDSPLKKSPPPQS